MIEKRKMEVDKINIKFQVPNLKKTNTQICQSTNMENRKWRMKNLKYLQTNF